MEKMVTRGDAEVVIRATREMMNSSRFWRLIFGHGANFSDIGTFSVPLPKYVLM